MKLPAAVALALIVITVSADAQEATNPIRHTWIATSVATWNEAASAFMLSNGDGGVIVLPTDNKTNPWVILRRVEAGSVYVPDSEPYSCEVFHALPEASTRFMSVDSCHAPLILTVPGGNSVVLSMKKCSTRRRAIN